MKLRDFYREFKRRNVFKAASASISIFFFLINIPKNIAKSVLVLILCFPGWLISAWVYAFLSGKEKNFAWLKKVELKIAGSFEAVICPIFKKFHFNPRWQKLIDLGVPRIMIFPALRKS